MKRIRVQVSFVAVRDSQVALVKRQCFFFVTDHVVGELGINDPDEREKSEPHWVPVDEIQSSENIRDYHRAFIKHLLNESHLMHAVVEWNPPNDDIQWKILDQLPTFV